MPSAALPVVSAEACRLLLLEGRSLLDVRAPVEFAQGAFPAASNLPLLDDEERAAVGLRYQQSGQGSALSLGHRLISGETRQARMDQWLKWASEHPDGVLYCFRGGLRSRTVQQWLSDSGVSVARVDGGYKALRRFLIDALPQELKRWHLVLLGGRTGTGKTHLLQRAPHHLDLESLARHRGSSFGRLPVAQPTVIDFEHALTIELMRKGNAVADVTPLLLEDEGRMIGRICLPQSLRSVMDRAPILLLEVPLHERIEVTLNDYVIQLLAHWESVYDGSDLESAWHATGISHSDPATPMDALHAHHRDALLRVQKRLGGMRSQQALKLLDEAVRAHREHGDLDGWRAYIANLLEHYYDPMYDHQLKSKAERVLLRGDADTVLSWLEQRRLVSA